MALNGEIPHKLARVTPPRCAGCLFGAMTKLPWRSKESKQTHQVYVATKPGECVSVDQMESLQVGFFAQLKGRLTKKRYTGATIFVDHFTRIRFIHLMLDLSAEETIKAKNAFELGMCTTWHRHPRYKKLPKTFFMTRTLNFKSA